MVRFPKEVPGLILVPVVVVGMVALALYLLGMVPAYLQSPVGGVKEYDSIEEAESELGFEIVVPAYFPSYLSWPPARILGKLEPIPMTQVLFLDSDRHTSALLIYQIISDREDLPIDLPWIETVLQEMPVTINGNDGELIMGRGTDGQLVNGVHWIEDGVHFVAVTTHPVQELLTLARSMHP